MPTRWNMVSLSTKLSERYERFFKETCHTGRIAVIKYCDVMAMRELVEPINWMDIDMGVVTRSAHKWVTHEIGVQANIWYMFHRGTNILLLAFFIFLSKKIFLKYWRNLWVHFHQMQIIAQNVFNFLKCSNQEHSTQFREITLVQLSQFLEGPMLMCTTGPHNVKFMKQTHFKWAKIGRFICIG